MAVNCAANCATSCIRTDYFAGLGAIAHWDPARGVAIDSGVSLTWTDQIGGYDAVSEAWATRLVPSSGLNGRASMTSTLADETRLVCVDAGLLSAFADRADYTIIVVRKSTNTTAVGVFLSIIGSGPASSAFAVQNNVTGVNRYNGGDYAGADDGVVDAGEVAVTSVVYDGTNVKIARDFGSFGSSAAAWDLTAPAQLFISVAGGNCFDGEFGDIVVFDRALTLAEKDTVVRFLQAKYGVA